MTIRLLTAATNPTTGTPQKVQSPSHQYKSHVKTLFVWGTFGVGGEFKLKIKPPGETTLFDVPNTTLTVQTALGVEFRAEEVSGHVTGGDGTTSLNAILY